MKKQKALAAILAAMLTVGTLAGCGSSSGDSGNKTGGKTEETPAMKWLTTGDAAAKPVNNDDRIVTEINKKIGIKLDVQVVPEGNVEKVNVAMASGDLPDIVTGSYGSSATRQWIDNSMVIALNDYFEKNPDLKKWDEETYPWSAIDGKYYGVPFITQYNVANTLITMRQDWLDKLNLSYPTTLDEMKTVLTAFTENDPDGNGKKDTFGFTGNKPSGGSTPLDWVFFAYGQKYADYSLDKDGNVVPWFEDDCFVKGMTYIKDLWDSGVIDSELMLNDQAKAEEKFYQGKAGAFLEPLFRHVSRHEKSLQALYPDASIEFALPPKGPDGSMGLSKQGKDGMFTSVTSACKNPDKGAAFINFMISEEGSNLLRLGIEGTHYTKDGDAITFNEEERAKDNFAENGWAHPLAWGSFYWPLESNYLPPTEPNADRALESVKLATEAQVPNLIKQKTPLEIKNGSALNDIYTQYFSDMLQGKISIEDGAKELNQKWRAQGGDELLKELTEAYKNQAK